MPTDIDTTIVQAICKICGRHVYALAESCDLINGIYYTDDLCSEADDNHPAKTQNEW